MSFLAKAVEIFSKKAKLSN
jgi:hypothetical protein